MNRMQPSHSDNAPRIADPAAGREIRAVIWSPPDVFRLLAALLAGLKWLIAAPVLAVLLTVIYLLATDPTYEIGAQVMVRYGNELTPSPTVAAHTSQLSSIASTRPEDITAEVQIMKDPGLVENVVATLGEDFFFGGDPPVTLMQKIKAAVKGMIDATKDGTRAQLVAIGLLPELSKSDLMRLYLQTALSINPVTRSDVIELSLAYPDPDLGEEVLRQFIAAYIAKRDGIYRDDRMLTYFTGELAAVQQDLHDAEEAYRQTRETLKAWSVEDQRSMNVQQREELVRAIRDTTAEMEVATARVAAIDAQLSVLPEWVPASAALRSNPVRDELALRLVDLKLKLEAERRQSGIRSQQVVSLTGQIDELQGFLDAEPSQVKGDEMRNANPLRTTLAAARADAELLITSTQRRIEILTAGLAEVEAGLLQIDTASLTLQRQYRAVERLQASEARHLVGLAEAEIAAEVAAARISNLKIVAEPRASIAPVRPRVFRTLLLVAIGGFMAAAGTLLLMDAIRPRLRSNVDILKSVGETTIVRAIPERRPSR